MSDGKIFWSKMRRYLTEQEQCFRKKYQCVVCGQKVEITKIYEPKDKHNPKAPRKIKSTRWPFECKDCLKQCNQMSNPTNGYDFGATRASVQHEYIRRMGGNFKDGN